MEKKFTIQEIKNYILSLDSRGDILYNLTADNIEKANQPRQEEEDNEGVGCMGSYSDH